jgi:RecJ-like exonuclease
MKNPNIDEIARNFLDKEAMETNYMLAMERIETVKKSLLRKVKTKQFKRAVAFLVNTDKEFEDGHFPSRGMMANIVSDELALPMKTPVITISHGTHNINTRFNKPALDAGWSGAELVKKVKEELPNALESGGGHAGAASMRLKKGFAKIVLDQLIMEIDKEAASKNP